MTYIYYSTLVLIKISCHVGHIVVDLCLIFRIYPTAFYPLDSKLGSQITGRCLAYVRRYDIIPQPNPANSAQRGPYPERSTSLYLLKRAMRTNGDVKGDIVAVDQIRALADVLPRFEKAAAQQLTKANCMEYSEEFWLNKYFDKELFLALTQ